MRNFAYVNKRIISASTKTLQLKLLPLSAAKYFTLRHISHARYRALEKQSFQHQVCSRSDVRQSHSILDYKTPVEICCLSAFEKAITLMVSKGGLTADKRY